MPAVVRRISPSEWAVLRRVRLAALADSPAAFASTLAREVTFGEEEWRSRAVSSAWFVAWPAARGQEAPAPQAATPGTPAQQSPSLEPLGLVCIAAHEEHPGSEWVLLSMWVHEGARGTGTATRLLDAAIAYVRSAGAQRLSLWVANGNARARAFYLRSGFSPTGATQLYRRRDGSELELEELALDPRGHSG
jgi:GNAT superfamily N-acetyltransferase